jgi:hypothetical protein
MLFVSEAPHGAPLLDLRDGESVAINEIPTEVVSETGRLRRGLHGVFLDVLQPLREIARVAVSSRRSARRLPFSRMNQKQVFSQSGMRA